MKQLLSETEAISSLEDEIQEKKKKIAKLAQEIEGKVTNIGNIEYEGKYYQIRKRKNGTSYVCGPRNEPFGSWRKKKK